MRKPWATKEWKDKRKEFIKDKSCEWCGSKETLAIHHKETFHSNYEREKIAFQIMCEYFQNKEHEQEIQEIRNKILQTTTIRYFAACPKCGKSMQSRKTVQPKYRCYRCNFNTDEPLQKPTWGTQSWLRKLFFQEWKAKHCDEIDAKFNPIKERENHEYLDFNSVMILCRKCHYADHKGYVLCPRCKQAYYQRGLYSVCFSCWSKFNPSPFHKWKEERTL